MRGPPPHGVVRSSLDRSTGTKGRPTSRISETPTGTKDAEPSNAMSVAGSASSTLSDSSEVLIGGNRTVPSSPGRTVRVPPGQVRSSDSGRRAAVPGSTLSASPVRVRRPSQASLSSGCVSSRSAIHVVSGSPSIAATARARGSGATELEASADTGWSEKT